jgi:chondroitin AC lyase
MDNFDNYTDNDLLNIFIENDAMVFREIYKRYWIKIHLYAHFKIKTQIFMKKRYSYFITIALMLCSFFTAHGQSDTLINRYKQYLFSTEPAENIEPWITSLDEKARWPDINYADKEPSNWQVSKHLSRIRSLSLAWANPQSSYYQNPQLWGVISKALNHWLEVRYKSNNWWHNQIGVPQYMRDIIILTGNKLAAQQHKQALDVLAQLKVGGTGANLVWSVDLGIHYAALTNNIVLINQYAELLKKEIKINTGEGIEPDYSFHQHGPRLEMYEYGKALFWEGARLAWQFHGTQWAFPKEKLAILNNFALEGWQWMARGINTVPGTIDRSVSREGELHSADIRNLIPFLCELSPEKSAAYKALAERQNGHGALAGYRYFPYSDFTAYHTSNFSFFLKTVSTRTLLTESINNENLKGGLLNSGDAYLINDGNEYYNLMPVWDWQKLPGITNYTGNGRIKRLPFVGNVSDGKSGLSVMDYKLEEGDKSLSAHKFWAMYKNLIVCLIANLQTNNISGNTFTVLDQCRWRGDVTVNKPGFILSEGTNNIKKVKWIHHAGFSYIPLEPATMNVNLKTATGLWTSINKSQSNKIVKENVFTPEILYSSQKPGLSSGYILASCKNVKETMKLANNPTWKILRNDKDCQAVCFKDKTIMASFFEPVSLIISHKYHLQADRPCLILFSKNKLFVSDPVHKGETIKINFNDKVFDVLLPNDGTSSEIAIL